MQQTVRRTGAVRWLAVAGAASILVACAAEDELPGDYFEIKAIGEENDCTDGAANLDEKFEYRVVLDGNTAELAIGADVFATGRLEGCLLSYESVVWEEKRDGGEISWQIIGSATVNIDDSCPPPVEGEDWIGPTTARHAPAPPGASHAPRHRTPTLAMRRSARDAGWKSSCRLYPTASRQA